MYGMALCEFCLCLTTLPLVMSCTVHPSGRHHSYNDMPAVVYRNGSKYWFKNGIAHRDVGPAMMSTRGKFWYVNGMLHRMDGPAIEYSDHHVTVHNRRWYLGGRTVNIPITKEVIVGKTVMVGDDVATVIKHIEGVFYEILLGNKKVLVHT